MLVHGGVGGHVGEIHQRQTACKQTGTATDLHGLVAEYIIYETYTGRYLDVGLGPETGVDLLAAEVKSQDSVVGHEVVVVVEDGVQTETGGHLELFVDVPLVLAIETNLGEADTGRRSFLAVITIGKGHDFRSLAVHKVVNALEAVVTGAFTHIGVICKLVLVAEAGGELVVAHEIGDIVLEVQYTVVNTVVPGEELVTCGDVGNQRVGALVVRVGLHDINEGELVRVRTTDILDVGIGDEQLVGQVVAEAAVQVEGV